MCRRSTGKPAPVEAADTLGYLATPLARARQRARTGATARLARASAARSGWGDWRTKGFSSPVAAGVIWNFGVGGPRGGRGGHAGRGWGEQAVRRDNPCLPIILSTMPVESP